MRKYMNRWKTTVLLAAVALCMPVLAQAQIADGLRGMHRVLDNLYDELMPLCGQLIGVGSGIAGFAALWYIAARVWKHLANAEPIDFYPLLRPFAIGFCVIKFTLVLGIINGIMKPTVTGTGAMMDNSNKTIESLLAQREKAVKGSRAYRMYVGDFGFGDKQNWLKYTQGQKEDAPDVDEGFGESIGSDFRFAAARMSYDFRNWVKNFMAEVLRVLFEAAALCINTLRTFNLVVLAILGPLVFALAVFDGFQHTLTVWLARYINIYLWLPVANIFGTIIGKIQEKMLEMDLSQIAEHGDTFFTQADTGYLVFMLIGIVGYFTVPSVANYIVHAAGGSALNYKVTSMFTSGSKRTAMMGASVATGGAAAMFGAGAMSNDSLGDAVAAMKNNMAEQKNSESYFKDKLKGDS